MRNTCRARVASSCPNSTHAGDIEDALMRRAVSRPRIQLEPLHLECTTMLPVFEKREVVTGWRHPWFVYHKQSVLHGRLLLLVEPQRTDRYRLLQQRLDLADERSAASPEKEEEEQETVARAGGHLAQLDLVVVDLLVLV